MFIIAFDISSSFLNLQVIGLGSATKILYLRVLREQIFLSLR
jgi:hypothetical protein